MTRAEAATMLSIAEYGVLEAEERDKFLEAYDMAIKSLMAWNNVLERINIDLDYYETEVKILQDANKLETARIFNHKLCAAKQIKIYIEAQLEGI